MSSTITIILLLYHLCNLFALSPTNSLTTALRGTQTNTDTDAKTKTKTRTKTQQRPNIFVLIADDFGWAEAGFNRAVKDNEVRTPNMDALAQSGLILNRHYVFYLCSPTRTSFQTGRLPYRVNTDIGSVIQTNVGIPRDMECIGNKLKGAGYSTTMVGKWDVGMSSPQHTPRGRGYDSSLIYFGHQNDYWTQAPAHDCSPSMPGSADFKDLWKDYAPAASVMDRLQSRGEQYIYEEDLFAQHILDRLEYETADRDTPFFMVYASHLSHYPMEVPLAKYLQFADFKNDEADCAMTAPYIDPTVADGAEVEYRCRGLLHSMVSYLDDKVGLIVESLKANGFWENTLFVFTTDNGGSLQLTINAGNNYPLRGGKYSAFEGGIRGISFVSGGYLPPHRRHGDTVHGLMHVADWFATFSHLAGADAQTADVGVDVDVDVDGDGGGNGDAYPVVLDSINMWPLLSGQVSVSPRTTLMIDENTLIVGDYKLLTSAQVPFASWTGMQFPNASSVLHDVEDFNADCSDGCLYNVAVDSGEHQELSSIEVDKFNEMWGTLKELQPSGWQNNEDGVDDGSCLGSEYECACVIARDVWGGFYGPWQYLDTY